VLKKNSRVLLSVLTLVVIYFLTWPVVIEPVSWQVPANYGYSGAFAPNEKLKAIKTLSIGDNFGPEDIALDSQGRIYASTHAGNIVRLDADGSNAKNWINTGGRPLGIDFDYDGNLIIADAFQGLLFVSPEGKITELTTMADGIDINYANDVDVAKDGKIYFTDASTKFGAKASQGTYEASLLDLMEHGSHGRLLVYDPQTQQTKTLFDKLNFANGVAVSHDQSFVLVNETGNYRVLKYWLTGAKKGQYEPLIEELPSFPDNITAGLDGRFWVALVSPRNALLDKLSDKPFIRKIIQRMPEFIRPKAVPYGHIIAIDASGKVVKNLQQPQASYPINTSVTETHEYLYIGSLMTPLLGRLAKSDIEF